MAESLLPFTEDLTQCLFKDYILNQI